MLGARFEYSVLIGIYPGPPADVDRALKGCKSEAERLEYLRLQIEMRVLGLGWSQYATRWSSKADERIGARSPT